MRPIVVLDSGVGGLPYLSWIREYLPFENLLYIADRLYFPYGEKTPDNVRRIVVELARRLVERYNPKILIVACNTASVHALEALREEIPIPVVGVVPAVKTAAAATRNKKIAILATELTVRSAYLDRLIADFAADCSVMSFSAGDIVRFVEEDYLFPNHEQRDNLLKGWAQRIMEMDLDTVVLGCTHFLHVIPELQRFLGKEVILVDSQSGVGKRAASLLKERNELETDGPGGGVFRVRWTDQKPLPQEDEHKYRVFAQKFGLRYEGICGEEG